MIVRYDTHYERPTVFNLEWEPLFKGAVWLSQDVYAVSLAQSTDLDKESSQMQHCVSTYDHYCYQGNAHIVSLRNREGVSLSTIEIVYREECTPAWKLKQHRGSSNKPPEEGLCALVPFLLDHIEKNADLPALKQWQATAKGRSAVITPVKRDIYQKFDVDRLRTLSQAMGSKRLMSLFMSQATIKEAEQKFRNKNKVFLSLQVS